jgi:RNA polymerase sigma-70 factor (ECF subfamily)
VGGWLHRVASNLLVSRARHERVVARESSRPGAAPHGDPISHAVVDREQWAAVRLALDRLPDDQRTLLLLAAGGRSSEELAARFGISAVAARTRLHRARRQLALMADGGAGVITPPPRDRSRSPTAPRERVSRSTPCSP